ncbi:MAG: hypothetical protein N4A57_01095 [Anaeromicrobium sp.]|nr:hypothetical protein [Anaeromicrobium sp.]MCT4592861.1 hypothetical protein [Anaeromicrobium sp.]
MKRLSFILKYILKPETVGAILPSSNYLATIMEWQGELIIGF